MNKAEVSSKTIYLILVAVLVFPLLKPMGLPLPLMQGSKILYDEIEKLQSGQTVLMSLDWAVEQSIELIPQVRAVMQHVFEKPGVKIALVSFFEQGPVFGEQLLAAIDLNGKEYGVDYVNMGFIPGGEAMMAGFAQDPIGFVKTDFHGNSLSGIKALEGVTEISGFDLLVVTDSGTPGAAEWVRQVQVPHGVKMACLGTLGTLTMAAPFVQGGQLFALLGGVRGAAEYETLTRKPSLAAASMDAQSIGHVYFLILIIVGNIVGRMNTKKATS